MVGAQSFKEIRRLIVQAMVVSYPVYNYSDEDVQEQLAKFVRLDNPDTYPFDHHHAHQYNEIIVFLKGGGIHNISFVDHEITNNSIHMLAGGDLHWMERSLQSSGFAITFKEQFLYKLEYVNPLVDYRSAFSESRIMHLNDHEAEGFEAIFREMLNNSSNKVYMFNLIGTFLTKIVMDLDQHPVTASRQYDTVVVRAFELINRHYKDRFTLEQYAQLLNMSPVNLQKRMKSHSGKSIHILQQERLVIEAKRLIVQDSRNINEIALELGFKETAHFSNWFRTKTGESPSSYKIK